MMLGAAVLSILPSLPPAAAADPPASDSAVTKSGNGDFAKLTVTVSQTQNLINQTITVSWIGAAPTVTDTNFSINYLQIMQCWGDDPAGPDRTQCQFGRSGSQDTDGWVGSRQVSYRNILVDPQETLAQPQGSLDQAYVPFWPVGAPQPTGPADSDSNDFFDSQVTNEIPLARTHGDGTGQEHFEVETVRQAAGLGCGDPVTTGGVTTGRSCWLVIVPRNNKEVDGSLRTGKSGLSHLSSSPLSQSNWDNRIFFSLGFQPVGQACPIGAPERPVIGHELAVEAVTSWQPALCGGGGALFSYTQLTDDVARGQAQDGRLALVTDPIPPDQVRVGHPLVYAPVGLSGLAFAFNIDHQPPGDAPAAALQVNGERFTSMKLTPRLVAKLLTQSYRDAVPTTAAFSGYLKTNPFGLLTDPEFLTLNPEYLGFVDPGTTVPDVLVQLNGADVTSLLWRWVKADSDANAFLAGTPDPSGMVINKNNKNLTLPTSVFPRNDQSCEPLTDAGVVPPVSYQQCALDAHPFATDMHDAGRSASRGDSLARNTTVDPNSHQPVSTKGPRQPAGHQGLLAVVDTATAARYGLPTAQLRNTAGNFIAPTTTSLLASEAGMTPSTVTRVLAPDPAATDPAAYPLTALSYAVASPSTLDPAAGRDYATFLRYAAGLGQQQGLAPGQLPLGMVPLPDPLKAQTIAAADTIEAQSAQTAQATPTPSPTTTGTTQNLTGGPDTAAGTSGGARNPGDAQPAGTPAAVPTPSGGPPAKAPSVAQLPVAGVRRTPSLPVTAAGALLVAVLIVGAVTATSSPITWLLSGGLRRRWRKGVPPTEQ